LSRQEPLSYLPLTLQYIVAFAEMLDNYYYYLETGDLEAAYAIAETTKWEGVALAVNVIMDAVANRVFDIESPSNALVPQGIEEDVFKTASSIIKV
jgi:hypothetical protein